jgi:hypothetical protein
MPVNAAVFQADPLLPTSKSVFCTAFLAEAGNSPPTPMTYLTIIAKTKQKAAN